ncbi:MAG TPA: hypothetical protein VF395_02165 [Polyangiaceae bacterium]
MLSPRSAWFVLALLSLSTAACGSHVSPADRNSGAPIGPDGGSDAIGPDGGSGGCAAGTVAMGGACISLGRGAVPCANPANSGFDGDTQCIEAPDPAAGMQLHYGPSNYDDPAEMSNFVIHSGEELVDCMFMKTPNETDIHFDDFHVRLRTGTHHMITYVQPQDQPDSTKPVACKQGPGFTFLVGATAPNTDIHVAGMGAPEFEGAAMLVPARSQAAVQMHFINTTDHDRLKEGWINMMYLDGDKVKLEMNPITWLGGLGMSIGPHTHVVTQGGAAAATELAPCQVTPEQGDLDVIATVAHAHSHTQRVAAFIQRAGETERTKFYEDYNWEEPTFVYYNSVTNNPVWDPLGKTTGGLSGRITAHPGDKLSWECEVDNNSDNLTLQFSDKALTGEMCNIFGVYAPAKQPWNCLSL